MTRSRATNRWAGVDAVAWGTLAVGLLAREPAVLLLAAVGVAVAAYARAGGPPTPELQLARELDDVAPEPGDEVAVRLTVHNDGEQILPDVRVVDGVPDALAVTDGSAHLGTALRPGETVVHAYAVRAERGTHAFSPVTIACRNLGGAHEVDLTETVETSIECRPSLVGGPEPPLRDVVALPGGRTPTAAGGEGLEFHGVREHRPGDSARRIDWARLARTGELATVTHREERSATVVLLVDARGEAYVRSGSAPDHGVEWGVRAAGSLFAGLLEGHHAVGLAAIGRELAWLGPGAGEAHRRRGRELLAAHPALSPAPPSTRVWASRRTAGHRTRAQLRRLGASLPTGAQVVFCTPLPDDGSAAIARRLQAGGNAVTVVCPDVTGGRSPGARLERLGRTRRIRSLHRADVPVVDWDPTEPLGVALERAREAWR